MTAETQFLIWIITIAVAVAFAWLKLPQQARTSYNDMRRRIHVRGIPQILCLIGRSELRVAGFG